MPVITAATRRSAEQATLELPFRVPPQEWFTLQQAGKVLDLGESAVEKLYDKGELTGHSHNAATGQRFTKRVLRVTLIAYLIRTADYTEDSLCDALIGCLRHLPLSMLQRVAAACAKLIELKKFSTEPSVKFGRAASGK